MLFSRNRAISWLLLAATPCWRDPTRSKQLSMVAVLSLLDSKKQFNLDSIVSLLNFLSSLQLHCYVLMVQKTKRYPRQLNLLVLVRQMIKTKHLGRIVRTPANANTGLTGILNFLVNVFHCLIWVVWDYSKSKQEGKKNKKTLPKSYKPELKSKFLLILG